MKTRGEGKLTDDITFWVNAGKMILILLEMACWLAVGCAAKAVQGGGSGGIVITAGWAFAVMAGVLWRWLRQQRAHLNPAVTLGVCGWRGGIVGGKCRRMSLAQLLGGWGGATLVWLPLLPQGKRDAGTRAKGWLAFCYGPRYGNAAAPLISEITGTPVLSVCCGGRFYRRTIPVADRGGSRSVTWGKAWLGIGLSLVRKTAICD